MNGSDVEVLRRGGSPLVIGMRPDVEADRVGDDERADAEQGVRDDVERDEQAVVTNHRAASACIVSARTSASISSPNRSRPKRSACRRMASAVEAIGSSARRDGIGERLDARFRRRARPVSPATTVSSAPPRPSATTGRPHACASSGTMPKSSSPGSSTTALAVERPGCPRRRPGRGTWRLGLAAALAAPARSGPSPTIVSGMLGPCAGLDGQVDSLVRHERRHHERKCARAPSASGWKNVGVDWRIHHVGLAIIVSARSSPQHNEK